MRAALAARDAGDAAAGVALVSEGLDRHAGHAGLWQVLGLLCRYTEDSAGSMAAFKQAARLSPTDAKIAHGLARVTLEAGAPASGAFETAHRLSPSDGEILLGRAAALLAEGRAQDAIKQLGIVLRHSPQWLAGQAALARLRWMEGERQLFTADYERAVAAFPRDFMLWSSFLSTLVEADMFELADKTVTRARAAAGDHLALDMAEAICASELGDVSRADSLFNSLDQLKDVPFAVRHMRHLLRTGRVTEAAALGEPLTSRPEGGQVWPYMSLTWRLLGDPRSKWLDDLRFVSTCDLAEQIPLPRLARCLRTIHTTNSYPLGQSVRGGTQTDGPLFARIDPEIRLLRELVKSAVERHLIRLQSLDRSHPYLHNTPQQARFAGSWSVRLTKEGHHTNHFHPQGWLSSAFYVAVPDEQQMGPAPAGWLRLGQPPAELELGLPPLKHIEPKPGRLVLFPSTMWHGTAPFAGGERLTVAFDVAGSR